MDIIINSVTLHVFLLILFPLFVFLSLSECVKLGDSIHFQI